VSDYLADISGDTTTYHERRGLCTESLTRDCKSHVLEINSISSRSQDRLL